MFELTGLTTETTTTATNTTDTTEDEEDEVTEGNWIIIGSVVGGVVVLSAVITGAIVYFKPPTEIAPNQNTPNIENEKV